MTTRNSSTPPLYLLPGMDRGYPVYTRLAPLLPQAILLDYIAPEPEETLVEYALRMALPLDGNCYVGGASLGGIIAIEMARMLRPRGCIVMSSITHPRQLPLWLQLWRRLPSKRMDRIVSAAGSVASFSPLSLQSRSTRRLSKLRGRSWSHWATKAVLQWSPGDRPLECRLLHIHGECDRTFPLRHVDPDVVINGAGHTMTVTHAEDTAEAINQFLSSDLS
jgi:pimeloyl-ACP methyl ester carboxylesterase